MKHIIKIEEKEKLYNEFVEKGFLLDKLWSK